MAKDDYFVIAYQILSYLYTCLKRGEDVNPAMLQADSPFLGINERYWTWVINSLLEQKLISGACVSKVFGGMVVQHLADTMITPKGIEYLTDNSFLSKAKEFLRDIKAIIPCPAGGSNNRIVFKPKAICSPGKKGSQMALYLSVRRPVTQKNCVKEKIKSVSHSR